MKIIKKDTYLAPEAEIIEIFTVDVILTSGLGGEGGDDKQETFVPSGSWVPID